jgi:hypothetical protein
LANSTAKLIATVLLPVPPFSPPTRIAAIIHALCVLASQVY